MLREIDPSSYACDCGHESHFFVNTIREAKAASLRREIRLGDSHANEHIIVFFRGEAVGIMCPMYGLLAFHEQERNQAKVVKAPDRPRGRRFKAGDRVVWLKRIPGGPHFYPVSATVLAVTAKRVKIEPGDKGRTVIRYVPTESLQRRK